MLIIVILITCLFFGLFFLALYLKAFFGKEVKRQCACAMSNKLVQEFKERERRKRRGIRYDPARVDIHDLPLADRDR